jgi:uncharacterized protein YgbK (DUF1537 family)
MHRLIAALTQGSMGPVAVADLLQISQTAARNYLEDLASAGVVECDTCRNTHFRLHRDAAAGQRFLTSLSNNASQRRVSLRRSPSRHCVNPGVQFLHVLADDVSFPLMLNRLPARRDPLVAALFGAAAHC